MSETKRISVFVPSYNHAPFVESCLKSIVEQTKSPAELLVIDDGSKDDSPKIIERVLNASPFPAELIVNRNKGLCATLNEGLKRTRGDYFAYLGSDDLWFPEFLESRFRLLEARPNAVLGYGHGHLIDEDNAMFDSSEYWRHLRFPDGDARPLLHLGTAPLSPTVFYRRAPLENRGWNENSKLEDYELYLQLAEDGEFAFDPKVLAAWRKHGYNTSRDLDFMLRECLNAQRRVAKIFGWNKMKLRAIQRKTRFFHALALAESGYKSRAFLQYVKNFRGASSRKLLYRALRRLYDATTILEE